MVEDRGLLRRITATEIKAMIGKSVGDIELYDLYFSSKEVGVHSSRSEGVMEMHLANVPVYNILVVGL